MDLSNFGEPDYLARDHKLHTNLHNRFLEGDEEAKMLLLQIVLSYSKLPIQLTRFKPQDSEELIGELVLEVLRVMPLWDPYREPKIPWRAFAKQRIWWRYNKLAAKRYKREDKETLHTPDEISKLQEPARQKLWQPYSYEFIS